ncbi:hypothetical protein GLOIN_2v1488121 [Rhizophagus clarus]|uniref:Uncharacterized protein n=1 Tax=Rhizophagus clarus TaxID=94130 RepID=A0A8H3M4R4_9GLOM|nr:hypothetical protein GLOIN_2v1488121 [Rhizophagus clarus]
MKDQLKDRVQCRIRSSQLGATIITCHHKSNYEISSSEQESSSDEEKFSSNQIFSKKDDVHVCNHDSNDEGRGSDESIEDKELNESEGEESSKSDENEIISGDLPIPIIKHLIPSANIDGMANSNFFENDDQTFSDNNEQDFSNEIYHDFVVHHKLSNDVGDAFLKFLYTHANLSKKMLPSSTRSACQFLDSLMKKYTLFNSIPIINIGDIQYNFEYRPILSGIEEIVGNAEIAKELVFDYNEIWINQKWKQANNHVPYGKGSKQKKKTKEFREAIQITFHKYFEILLAPIQAQEQIGIQLKVGNSYVWCTMIVAMILGDWPENEKYCLTYGGSKCQSSCHSYLIDRNNLNKINLTMEEILPKTHATVPEKMHHLDLDLFPYMIEFTHNLLKNQRGNALIEKMDTRLATILRHHGLKIFHNRLADLARFTILEYQNMMQVMPFVLDGLLEGRLDSKLIGLYLKWNDMYIKSRKSAFTEIELDDFEKLMKSWAKDFILIGSYSDNQCQYPKLHHFLYHMIPTIKNYGSPNVNELKIREGSSEIIDGLEDFLEAYEYLKII